MTSVFHINLALFRVWIPGNLSKKKTCKPKGGMNAPINPIKSLTSSRLGAANKVQSVFCGGVYVAKNTLRGAECRSPAYSGARRGAQ